MIDSTKIQPKCFNERAAVYKLLGRLWLSEIDQETIDWLSKPQIDEAFRDFGMAAINAKDMQLNELAVDYCRILLGPSGHVSPLQSVAVHGLLHSELVTSMQDYLKYVNVPRLEGQMLDHLGFQMQAMSVILDCEPQESLVAAHNNLAGSFFRDHIAWAANICDTAAARANTSFYRSMINLTSEFVGSEIAFFDFNST